MSKVHDELAINKVTYHEYKGTLLIKIIHLTGKIWWPTSLDSLFGENSISNCSAQVSVGYFGSSELSFLKEKNVAIQNLSPCILQSYSFTSPQINSLSDILVPIRADKERNKATVTKL